MSAYAFETITAAQAAAYVASGDSLDFQTPGTWAALASVRYVAAVGDTPEMAAVSLNGTTVNFGAGVYGDTDLRFPDGSMLFIGGPGSDAISATAFADALFGGQGTDSLDGGAGGDFLQGNQGGDSLSSAAGDDFVYGGQGDDTIDLGLGANFGQGNLGNDTVSAAGSLDGNTILGGQGDDVVTGGAGNDFLVGNLGADSVSGGDGADTISGEGGADSLDGGAGSDVFVMAAGSSSLSLAGADRIFNWSSEDRIDVAGAGGQSAYYLIPPGGGGGGYYGIGGSTPITFDSALSKSNSWMDDHHAITVVTALVVEGVAVFVDSNGDHFADLAILLVGKGVFDVSGANFI